MQEQRWEQGSYGGQGQAKVMDPLRMDHITSFPCLGPFRLIVV